jgi:primosomal protein N' (replication factor Y) (superfamily II helicase)
VKAQSLPRDHEEMPLPARYCDVSLPVPLDRPFTYELPLTMRLRTQPGARVLVPFGSRKLTGVVLRLHNESDAATVKEALKLIDETPVLDAEMLLLGAWIAEYYCSPLGEVLRGMLPLSGEMRRSVVYVVTETGRDIARQLSVNADRSVPTQILRCLEQRPRSIDYLARQTEAPKQAVQAAVQSLTRKGWLAAEESQVARDPLRAPASRLQVEFKRRPANDDIKLKKQERELLAFLELHPGAHELKDLGEILKKSSEAARSLARRELVALTAEMAISTEGFERPAPELNAHQQAAFAEITAALDANKFQAMLLEGVTGSGKTEVYMRSIEAALERGKNALLLVPEIALTPAVAGQFFHRFGNQVAILHSAFSDAERADQWRRIREGRARVVVGTRSGVFAPVQNLGLVIVDEEHDGSYKQQEAPRYHGRDVAVVRARNAGAVAILGSATPSIETRQNANASRYKLIRLPERIASRPMPAVEVIDMRQEFLETRQQATFSRKLMEKIEQRLGKREQVMLLLNRRGFSSFMVCRACGERLPCTNCSVSLTYHKRDRRMLCHYCGYAEKIPEVCPRCSSDHIQFLGTGSERVEAELFAYFPTARIARLDRDTAGGKGVFEETLRRFRHGDVDILVGTQMIAKGHDIPNVTLVGVVLADIGLAMPDFRAAERSFQLLTQAAGRAGRGDLAGEVVIQTLNPDHYAIQFASAQDYEGFAQRELEFRKWLRYPPFAALANVLVRAEKQEDALRMATAIGYLLNPPLEGMKVMGPAEAPVPRLKNEFRYQLLLKSAQRSTLRRALDQLRRYTLDQRWPVTAVIVDVDPLSLM